MYYPRLNEIKVSRQTTEVFNGYNHNYKISEGEFYDTKNLTSDYYPVLSPRSKRKIVAQPTTPAGISGREKLAYVDGTNLVYGTTTVAMNLSEDSSGKPKQLVSMGAYLLIFPDKKYLNTQALSDYGSLENTVTTSGTVTFSLCKINGTDYTYTASATAPTSPANGDCWYDTANNILKQYSSNSAMWTQIATTYVKIACTGIGLGFDKYDGVNISGCTATGTTALNNTFVIYDRGDDYIVVVGTLSASATQSTAVTVKREVPDMDFVIESNNRLWGCYYGYKNSQPINEIYGCKLGDPFNWNCFAGLSTDSYTVSVGTDGDFTGAITYATYPLFFKENCIHKIYGTMPSNYQVLTNNCRGVQKDSELSLAIVNEILYYKALDAICAYNGSQPTTVSSKLGDIMYSHAVAGAYRDKYYICMKDKSNVYHLLVYDTGKGIWIHEDNTQVLAFSKYQDDLYFIDVSSGDIMSVGGSGTVGSESDVEWYAETGNIGYGDPDKKYISRFNIRMGLDTDSYVDIYIQYNSSGTWEHQAKVSVSGTDCFTIPVIPRRCDHMKIKFAGKGMCKIYMFAKLYEQGGDA